jgi:hypothetical protein
VKDAELHLGQALLNGAESIRDPAYKGVVIYSRNEYLITLLPPKLPDLGGWVSCTALTKFFDPM